MTIIVFVGSWFSFYLDNPLPTSASVVISKDKRQGISKTHWVLKVSLWERKSCIQFNTYFVIRNSTSDPIDSSVASQDKYEWRGWAVKVLSPARNYFLVLSLLGFGILVMRRLNFWLQNPESSFLQVFGSHEYWIMIFAGGFSYDTFFRGWQIPFIDVTRAIWQWPKRIL